MKAPIPEPEQHLAHHIAEYRDTVEQIRHLVKYRQDLEVSILKLSGWQRDMRAGNEDTWYRPDADLQDAGRWNQSRAVDIVLTDTVYAKPKVTVPLKFQDSASKTMETHADVFGRMPDGVSMKDIVATVKCQDPRCTDPKEGGVKYPEPEGPYQVDNKTVYRTVYRTPLELEVLDRKVKWVLGLLSHGSTSGKVRDPRRRK